MRLPIREKLANFESWTSFASVLRAAQRRCSGLLLASLASGLLDLTVAADLLHPITNLTFKAEVSLKESFDSNVFLQDHQADPANLAAARAAGFEPIQASETAWVTSLLPRIGMDYGFSQALNLGVSYSPDITFYHGLSSEDYVAHRANFNFSGKVHHTTWEWLNALNYIDGNSAGPVFARPNEVPALGGIPIRDRRAAFIIRNGFRLTQSVGDWFVRPVASAYVHDFQTEQRLVPAELRSFYTYENYMDRQDINGGLDVGYKVAFQTHLVLGYRYGRQDQFKGPFGPGGTLIDSPYDNAYHRVLVGVEGSPWPWLKVSLAIGPDIRQFSRDIGRLCPGFNPDTLLCYLDSSFSLLPTTADAITLRSTRFEMPAFSSFSVYEDVRNDLLWRHKFSEQLAASAGIGLYIGDWQPPVHRNDWIYSPNGSVSYAFSTNCSAELAYSYDWADSHVSTQIDPLTKQHEFTRHLVTVGVKYAF